MLRIHARFSLLIILATTALARLVVHDETFQPHHILRVTAQHHNTACHDRYSVLVNGSFPGPELRLREGQVHWIRVYNDLPQENLTMHWHGLSAFTAPFSDGTPAASQWPIPSGHYFDYEVRPEPGSAGTYFYHSHVGFQAITATGPLIVESNDPPPYQYDEERIVMLSDFFNKTDQEIEDGLTSTPFTWSGETEALLVNGQGRPSSDAIGSCELATLAIDPGKTYRLRFIGATALSFVWLGFESHDVSIIEADGHYTKPLETNFLQIASGQRYSVLLKAKTEEQLQKANRRHFYMQLTTLERPQTLTTVAILEYPSSTPPDVTTVPSPLPLPIANTTQGWLDYELEPLESDRAFPTLEEVTRRIIINVHQNVSDRVIWLQSGYDWTDSFPKTPYLVDIYQNQLDLDATYQRALARGNGFDNITRTFPARMGEVLEIVWQNQGTVDNGGVDTHPFHAHGRHYYDIGGGDGLYNATENEQHLRGHPPVLRDTSVLYRYRKETTPRAPSGWRAWRIRVSNPGVWMMHCHVLQHMIMGMQTVFTFGDRENILAHAMPVDPGYLTFGGSAYGNATFCPRVQHFFD